MKRAGFWAFLLAFSLFFGAGALRAAGQNTSNSNLTAPYLKNAANLSHSPILSHKLNEKNDFLRALKPTPAPQNATPKRANNPKDFGQFHFGDEDADEKREAEKRETIYELDLGGGVKFGIGGDFLQADPAHPIDVDDVNGFLKYNKKF